jgi:hypothetical protein
VRSHSIAPAAEKPLDRGDRRRGKFDRAGHMSRAATRARRAGSRSRHSEIRLLAAPARRVRRQMAPRERHLTVASSSPSTDSSASSGCRSEDCGLAVVDAGRCRACLSVYASAAVLDRRLVAREMARLELRTPGLGHSAMAAFQDRLARLDPPITASTKAADASVWVPEEWELERLEAFLAELREGRTDSPGVSR